ncbi:SPFH domain-containing protein [Gordonia malaquae]|uniref:SPFH domain-containing protein n=1 Tax=Gordonia malaquae TaxID=410332 RepID=UPI0030C79A38
MPGLFIAFIVLGAIALLFAAAGFGLSRLAARAEAADHPDAEGAQLTSRAGYGVAILLAAISALMLLLSSTTIVSTRNVGVETKFGRPTGSNLSNGFHWKNPLSQVHEMDGAVQNLTRTGEQATTVRLGNNSLATVDNTIRWRIKPDAAPQLYLDYRSFEGVTDNLVVRQANAALNEVLGGYNPLASLEEQNNENANVRIARQVRDVLRREVGDDIVIEQVIIPVIRFDQPTQQRIDQFNTEVANTRVAEQRQSTARADAEANRIISDSVKNDPNVITSRCVDAAIKANISPAGCWPGTTTITGIK